MRIRNLLLAAAVASASVIARADTVYTYTGNNFTNVSGVFTKSDFVSGSFTAASPLGDNQTLNHFKPVSFSFNDGVQTLDTSNTSFDRFVLKTNSNGALVDWSIELLGGGGIIFTSNAPQVEVFSGDLGGRFGGNSGLTRTSGTFSSVAATPEPGSLLLLGTGLLGLVGMGWRRLA